MRGVSRGLQTQLERILRRPVGEGGAGGKAKLQKQILDVTCLFKPGGPEISMFKW